MCSNKIRTAVEKKLNRSGFRLSAKACCAPLSANRENASIASGFKASKRSCRVCPDSITQANGDAIRLLDLHEEILGSREIDLAGVRLDVEQLDDAVDDQHRIALGAQPETAGRQVEVEAYRFGEVAVAVG